MDRTPHTGFVPVHPSTNVSPPACANALRQWQHLLIERMTAVAPHARIDHSDIRPGDRLTFDAQRTGNRERRCADSRGLAATARSERVPERAVLPQLVRPAPGSR